MDKMFKPKTEKISVLASVYSEAIKQLNGIFDKPSNVYIDFANVIHWSEKLGWRIDLERLKQFLDSFDTINNVRFYNGTVPGDQFSEGIIKQAEKNGYIVKTKPIKKMHLLIDVSGIPNDSPAILQNFIKKPLLKKLDIETIEFLNNKLAELNRGGVKFVEQWKCNFDVEMGRDMYLDFERNGVQNFILWSGDSDFADPIEQLLQDKKQVVIFATSGRIAPELNATGVLIFEIWKIKDFICWQREISDKGKLAIKNAKGTH